MSFLSIQCFAKDGRIDAKVPGKILEIAKRNNIIDQNEIRVLRNIVAKIKPEEVDSDMKQKLEEVGKNQ